AKRRVSTGPGTSGWWSGRGLRTRRTKTAADVARECLVRSFTATSALCLSITEATVFTLHTGDGRAHYGYPASSIFESCRPLHVYTQRRRHEESRNDHLRSRLDATHLRHADHSDRGDCAIAPRKRRARWWRCECSARTLEHPGRHRYGRRLRHLSWLSQDTAADRHRSCDLQ